MQLSRLLATQWRFTNRFAASLTFLIGYLALFNLQVAHATETDSITHDDHNHPLISNLRIEVDQSNTLDWERGAESSDYEPEFVGIDRGIIGRAPPEITILGNNAARPRNIRPGEKQYWVFPNETLWSSLSPTPTGVLSPEGWKRDTADDNDSRIPGGLDDWHLPQADERKIVLSSRQTLSAGTRTLYVTLNTCLQPSANFTNLVGPPPQLQMYVSLSDRNQRPGGPDVKDPDQRLVPVQGGFGNLTVNATAAVYIGVAAPNITELDGIWNYELAASIDAPYHSYASDHQNLFFIDSDTNSALLVTSNMTQADSDDPSYGEWMAMSPPFSMFAHNENDSAIKGLENSYCGLKQNVQIVAGKDSGRVDVGMTNRGPGNKPKEQFHIKSLNGSSTYYGFLAMDGNSTHAGGGVVGDGNCQLLFDLPYCSEVAYAVPSNPKTFPNIDDLKTLYDDNARNLWQNFSYSLQQIPCNTTSSAQYSLARNCDDCAAAYKTWLCAVTIPRCYDFSSNMSYLQPRNVAQDFINGTSPSASSDLSFSRKNQSTVYMNSSRNSLIDTNIQPGPYKEVLPCQDLCYTLVQSCPAALGFACPLRNRGLEQSYGVRDPSGAITCSFPGAAYFLSDAGKSGISSMTFIVAVFAALWTL